MLANRPWSPIVQPINGQQLDLSLAWREDTYLLINPRRASKVRRCGFRKDQPGDSDPGVISELLIPAQTEISPTAMEGPACDYPNQDVVLHNA